MRGTKGGFFNGRNYISLSKRMDIKEGTSWCDYSYHYFSDNHYAYVIDNVKAIKAIYIKEYYDFFAALSQLPIPIRYSFYQDEYQVKNEIPLEKIVGIKIPNLQSDFVSFEQNSMVLDNLLNTMNMTGYSFPFIDVENKKMIEKKKIKDYMIKSNE